jgi:hypothetical protein
VSDYTHEATSLRGGFAYCLRGLWWHFTIALGRFVHIGPLHDWCDCCSPSFCCRCGKQGPYE